MPPQALAAVVAIVGVVPHGNRIEFKLDSGSAEIVWLSPSAFRFRRDAAAIMPPGQTQDGARAPVELEVEETAGEVRVRSKFLEVALQKRGLMVRVRKSDGSTLMTDVTDARPSGTGGFSWSRSMRSAARYYGLGPREDPRFDLRGKVAEPASPFLYSTLGYGEYFPRSGPHRFDFTAPDRYRIDTPLLDYYFYYGPTIKQVMEEHKNARGPTLLWPAGAGHAGSWDTLRSSLLRIVQGAISAAVAPSFDLGAYAGGPPSLQSRARQLGSLVEEVSPGKLGLDDFRGQLSAFYDVYTNEAHEKGYPIWHPLPFQFPEDPECAMHADEFMLGDEMLVAPIVTDGNTRTVYLPQGTWTNLETNEVFAGRRTITVNTTSLPVFARNGSIVPLNSTGGIALHYFPKLAAEFFLLDGDGWTQIHAAPAAEIMRLEIESKRPRDYLWVVHHVARPLSVGFDGENFREAAGSPSDRSWSYDAKSRNLQVRVRLAAGQNSIVNISFE